MEINNNAISTIILDDEPDAISLLEGLIREFCPQLKVIYASTSSVDALKAIKRLEPQLVLLDIEMPNLDGFEVVELLEKNKIDFIFVSAYDQYVVKALRERAFDYLMKPVNPEELEQSVVRLVKHLNTKKHKPAESTSSTKISVPVESGFEIIECAEIEFIEADNSYSFVYMLGGKKLLVCKNLKRFEKTLDSKTFLRAHRSYLVNLDCVERVSRADGGFVQLKSGKTIHLPQRKKDQIFQILKDRFLIVE
jgi:two-component system LytT family response regulator